MAKARITAGTAEEKTLVPLRDGPPTRPRGLFEVLIRQAQSFSYRARLVTV